MTNFDGQSATLDHALHVHQTPHVAGRHGLRPGGLDVGQLGLKQCLGNFRVLHGKGAAETATLVRPGHLHKLKTTHIAKQSPRLIGDTQAAQEMTGVMVGDPTVPGGAHIGHTEHVHQEFRKLVRLRRHLPDPVQLARIAGEELRVMMTDHVHTRTRRTHDGLGVLKNIQKPLGQSPRLLPVARIEGRLAAAGLLRGMDKLHTLLLQDPDHGPGRIGKTGINYALDEQRHPLWLCHYNAPMLAHVRIPGPQTPRPVRAHATHYR